LLSEKEEKAGEQEVPGGEWELCRLLHPGYLIPDQEATLENGTVFPGTQTVTSRLEMP